MYKLQESTKRTSCILALMCSLGMASLASANPHVPYDDDETILIDYQPSSKIPYSKIVRAVSKHFFNFDSDSLVTYGTGNRASVARNFSDYMERTRTRLNVREDKIELNVKMHF